MQLVGLFQRLIWLEDQQGTAAWTFAASSKQPWTPLAKLQFWRPWLHTIRAIAFDSLKSREAKDTLAKAALAPTTLPQCVS